MADAPLSPEEMDILAAELALGVLEGEDKLRAMRLQLSDPAFRDTVIEWQDRLAPMLGEIPDAPAGPGVWRRIEGVLEHRAPVAVMRKLRAWRAGAVAAGSLAAALALLLLFMPAQAPEPVRFEIAQLVDETGKPVLVAQFDRTTRQLRVRVERLPQEARLPELWVIPTGGTPHSLGLVDRQGRSERAIDMKMVDLLQPGATIAVTLEPADGAPHGAPTGTILGTAPLSTL